MEPELIADYACVTGEGALFRVVGDTGSRLRHVLFEHCIDIGPGRVGGTERRHADASARAQETAPRGDGRLRTWQEEEDQARRHGVELFGRTNRRFLRIAYAQVDVGQPSGLNSLTRVREHVRRQVYAHDSSGRPDALSSPQQDRAATAPDVEPALARGRRDLSQQSGTDRLEEVDAHAVVGVGHEVKQHLDALDLVRYLGHGPSVARKSVRR